MYGNGVTIGMVAIITVAARKITHRGHQQAPTVLNVAVAGAAARRNVGWLLVATAVLAIASTT